MRKNLKSRLLSTQMIYLWVVLLGVFCGLLQVPQLHTVAACSTAVFVRLLQFISVPVLFLSIVSVLSSFENPKQVALLGKSVLKYTLFTTIVAAMIALFCYLIVNPVAVIRDVFIDEVSSNIESKKDYFSYVLDIIPKNIIAPFAEQNVISALLLAFLIGISSLFIKEDQRKSVHLFFSGMYALFMQITKIIIYFIPFALWAFIVLFVQEMQHGMNLKTVGLYLLSLLAANCIQAFIFLPLFLRYHGIAPIQLAKAMLPAITLAFFTKSSSAVVPTAVSCAVEKRGMDKQIATFAFPLCTTVNMNACAAFILTTVLFVSMLHGVTYTWFELVLWIFIATLAAVGNAGVPMGCYFLASALLASMDIPLTLMGVILPFYSLIDAFETSINIWSDACVTSVVEKEVMTAKILKRSQEESSYSIA